MAVLMPQWVLEIDDEPAIAGDVSINWSLDDLTTVADIEIRSPSIVTPALGTPIKLWLGDRATDELWPVFFGYVQTPIGVSYPNRFSIRSNDPLSRLRDVWDLDITFTGDTGDEAIKRCFDSAEIDYNPLLIQTDSLVLGAIQEVVAPRKQKKAAIVSEITRLLGMPIVQIGFDLHRFWVDRAPAAIDITIVRTFTRGVDCEFFGNERSLGPIDDIGNYWEITGMTYPCGPVSGDPPEPTCRCTIWAQAVGTHPALGSGVRTEPQPESSDLIQDQDFAEWLAGERIRLSNRTPDIARVITIFDPGIHVGDWIGIADPIRGVRILGDAEDNPYLIERIELQNFTVTYHCRGRSQDRVNTITTGNEKRCNDTQTPGPPVSPGFTPPSIWPRITVTPDAWNPCHIPVSPADCDSGAFVAGTTTEPGYDWKISGTVVLNGPGDSLKVGIDAGGDEYVLTIGGFAFYSALMITPQVFELNGPGEYRHYDGSALLEVEIDYIISWKQSTNTLTGWLRVGDEVCYDDSIEFDPTTLTGAITLRSTTGAPTLSSQAMALNCGFVEPPPITLEWNDQSGTWTFADPDAQESANSGVAYSDSYSLDFTLASSWQISGTIDCDHGAGDVCFVVSKHTLSSFDPQDVGVANVSDWGFGGVHILGGAGGVTCGGNPTDHEFKISNQNSYTEVGTTPGCWNALSPIDFVIAWASGGTLTVTLTQGAHVVSDSNSSGPSFMPIGPYHIIFAVGGKVSGSVDSVPYLVRVTNLVVTIT